MTEKKENRHPPMNCENARDAVSAAIDDELAAAPRAQLEHHLQNCEPCRDYSWSSTALFGCLAAELSDQNDTDALWRKISAIIDVEQENEEKIVDFTGQLSSAEPLTPADFTDNDTARIWPRRRFMVGGAAAAVLLTAGGAAIERSLNSRPPQVVTETINDFLTFRASGRKLHVAESPPAEIKSWLAERVNFEILIDARPPKGFRLAGGRLCSFLNRRLVFLHYEQGDHAVSLYVMNEEGLEIPTREMRRIGNREVSMASLKGVRNVVWREEGLVYVVVSDLAEAEVLNFITEI